MLAHPVDIFHYQIFSLSQKFTIQFEHTKKSPPIHVRSHKFGEFIELKQARTSKDKVIQLYAVSVMARNSLPHSVRLRLCKHVLLVGNTELRYKMSLSSIDFIKSFMLVAESTKLNVYTNKMNPRLMCARTRKT